MKILYLIFTASVFNFNLKKSPINYYSNLLYNNFIDVLKRSCWILLLFLIIFLILTSVSFFNAVFFNNTLIPSIIFFYCIYYFVYWFFL
jgi:hypothetical protein